MKKCDPYAICSCGSNKKVKWCHPNGYFAQDSELEKDLVLGEALVREFDKEQKEKNNSFQNSEINRHEN